MNGIAGSAWLDPAAQARALAALLARLGLAAEVIDPPDGTAPPCVAVSGFAADGVAHGYVHAAEDQAGVWRWWLVLPGGPAVEAGGPLCEVSSTADAVSRALARAAQAGPPPSPEEKEGASVMFQAGVPVVARVFEGRPCLAAEARRWAAALLARTGADPEVTALLTSELFANAVLHTRSGQPGGIVTVLVTSAGVLHVHDHGPAAGSCAGPGGWTVAPERVSFGRGLTVVARLSAGLVHGLAAACPLGWPGDPAAGAGGCCTRCVPPALEAAPESAAGPGEQRRPHPAAA